MPKRGKTTLNYRHHQFDSDLIPIRHLFSSSPNDSNSDGTTMLNSVTHLGFATCCSSSSSSFPLTTSYFYYFAIHLNSINSSISNSNATNNSTAGGNQAGIGQVHRIHLPSLSSHFDQNANRAWIENLCKTIDLRGGLRHLDLISDPKSAYFYCMANKKAAELVAKEEQNQQKQSQTEEAATIMENNSPPTFVQQLVRYPFTSFRRESLPILGGDKISEEGPDGRAHHNLKFIGPYCLLFVKTEYSEPPAMGRFARECYSSTVFLLRIDEAHKCVIPTRIQLPNLPTRFLELNEIQGPMDRRCLYLDWTIRSSTFICDCDNNGKQNGAKYTENCSACFYHFPLSSTNSSSSCRCRSFDEESSTTKMQSMMMMQKFCLFNLDLSTQLVVYNWETGNWDKFQINSLKNSKPLDVENYDWPICYDYGFCCFFIERNGKRKLYKLNIDASRAEYWFSPLLYTGLLPASITDQCILNWEWLNNFVEIVYIGQPPSLKSLAFWKCIEDNGKNIKKMKRMLEGILNSNIDNFFHKLIMLINIDAENDDVGSVRIVPTYAQIIDCLKLHKNKK